MGRPYLGTNPDSANELATVATVDAKIATMSGGLTFVKLTQAVYTALGTKDANTVYMIVG